MAFWSILFLLFNFYWLSVGGRTCQSKEGEGAEFDHLVLAQFWPYGSIVYFNNEGIPWRIPPQVHGWTLHGLWPSIAGTEKPSDCNDSMKFDFNQIKSLYNSLEENWPYLGEDKEKTALWKHEWTKHGTCAYSMPQLRGEMRYFSTALNLHSKLHTKENLTLAKIAPSENQQYRPSDVLAAVYKSRGRIPIITCIYENKTKQYHLEQIGVCYDKSFNAIDCPPQTSARGKSSTLYFESLKEKTPTASAGETRGRIIDCPPHEGKVFYKPIPKN